MSAITDAEARRLTALTADRDELAGLLTDAPSPAAQRGIEEADIAFSLARAHRHLPGALTWNLDLAAVRLAYAWADYRRAARGSGGEEAA